MKWHHMASKKARCAQEKVIKNKKGKSRFWRPVMERLEDRLAPAVHDLTTPGTFPTIQAAVNAANPGDTLLADPGTYNESVTVNKSLIIEGNQHGVDAQTGRPGAIESIVDNSGGPFYITANNVT